MDHFESTPNRPTRYFITASPHENLLIPVFGGSMIRGAIGHALLDQCCTCNSDRHIPGCLYTELFETEAGTAFVITPPGQVAISPGESFTFRLTILRPTPQREQSILNALELALAQGLTSQRIHCRLKSIIPLEPSEEPLGRIALLHLLSPWFIKRGGQGIQAAQCGVHTLLIGMAQRQRKLIEQGLLNVSVPTNSELLSIADNLSCQFQLRDCRGERRSNRQKSRHPLSGFTGKATLIAPRGNTLAPLESVLRTAEWVHGGGKVSFGLGGLVVQGQTELNSMSV